MTAPILVFGYGNPSRGDDALGPEFVRRLAERYPELIADGTIDVLTDFQLQVEHALDLKGREQVFFVDATIEAHVEVFELRPVEPREIVAAATHAMSPGQLLSAHRRIVGAPTFRVFELAIRGTTFALGDELSDAAEAHLEAAIDSFKVAVVLAHAERV